MTESTVYLIIALVILAAAFVVMVDEYRQRVRREQRHEQDTLHWRERLARKQALDRVNQESERRAREAYDR